MGKDLSGNELGKGIVQRKDGRYFARYTTPSGKRTGKYFNSIIKCKEWLNSENVSITPRQTTVDNWFWHWITNIKKNTVRKNTIRNYTDRYMQNIRDEIGFLELQNVKPLHCQKVLNRMLDENYAGSTMEQTRITMYNMFYSAIENELIISNPVKRSVKAPRKAEKNPKFLTLEEQTKFLEAARGTSNYYQYLFLLNTGLRAGELIGLKWEDIDFENRQISINRSVSYDFETKEYIEGEPKSEHSYRKIPMTNQVYEILRIKYSQKHIFSKSRYANYVFINRNGEPTKNASYDSHIRKLAEKAGIEPFSMHTFRYTFATRCIEACLKPKTVQQLLGHSSINITMNLYVHGSDDEKRNEIGNVTGDPVEPSGTPVEPSGTPVEPSGTPIKPTDKPIEPTGDPLEANFLAGDADCSKKVDLTDAKLVLKLALGIKVDVTKQGEKNADYDKSGKVDLNDAKYTLKDALGIKFTIK